jgi:hypothetical protein
MSRGMVVMNRKGNLFIIYYNKKRVYFQSEKDLVFTEDKQTALAFILESFIEKQLFEIGYL